MVRTVVAISSRSCRGCGVEARSPSGPAGPEGIAGIASWVGVAWSPCGAAIGDGETATGPPSQRSAQRSSPGASDGESGAGPRRADPPAQLALPSAGAQQSDHAGSRALCPELPRHQTASSGIASAVHTPRRSTTVLMRRAPRGRAERKGLITANRTLSLRINQRRPWRHSRMLRGGTRPVVTFSPVTSPTGCAGRRSPCCVGSAVRARSTRHR